MMSSPALMFAVRCEETPRANTALVSKRAHAAAPVSETKNRIGELTNTALYWKFLHLRDRHPSVKHLHDADSPVAWHGRPPGGAPQPGARHVAARRGLDGRRRARHERQGGTALSLAGRAQADGRRCATQNDLAPARCSHLGRALTPLLPPCQACARWRASAFSSSSVSHTGLEPRTSRQGPRQVLSCYSHV